MKGQEYCKGVSTYMSEDSDNKDGQVVLEDKNGKKIKLITIIGEIEDTIIFQLQARQPSMNICFHSLLR